MSKSRSTACSLKFLLILFSAFLNITYAAPNATSTDTLSYMSSILSDLKNDASLTLLNSRDLILAPSHFRTQDIATATLLTGAVLLAFAEDSSMRSFAQSSTHSPTYDHLFKPGHVYGNGLTALAIGGGIYVLGLGVRNEWLHETGREALTALVLSGALSGVLKYTVGRARPYKNLGPQKITGFSFDDQYQSFPSGHSTTSFALSTVLAYRINNPLATAGLYSLAFLTAAQRIYSDNHWLSDVIMGASIGTLVGRFVVHNSKQWEQGKNSRIVIVPEISTKTAGVNLFINY